jgi:hypothetical protein
MIYRMAAFISDRRARNYCANPWRLTSICYTPRAVEPWNAGTKKAVFPCVNPYGEMLRGQTMAFIVFGVVIGALRALLRCPVLVLIPLSGLLAAAAVLNGIIIHADTGIIATEVLGSLVASQLIYVSVSLTQHLVRSRNAMLEIQAAIGRELRTELEVPRGLPPDLSALVTRLQFA